MTNRLIAAAAVAALTTPAHTTQAHPLEITIPRW